MLRFIHTADWQLGLKLRFIPDAGGADDRAAQLRAGRFEAVRAVAALAHDRQADAVLVAGDVFDDNQVGARLLQQARDALAAFAPIPVYLLPGNHDAATPGCALSRLQAGDHVFPLLEAAPVPLPKGATLYPCPLTQRHVLSDPTGWLPPRQPEDAIRVALAHGGVLDFGAETETPNLIDPEAVISRGIDYLALGDWHGLKQVHPRAWYSGAHEPTRFKELDPGKALVVEIDGPGAIPRVEAVPVAVSRWLRHEAQLSSEADVEALEAWFAGLPERSKTLVRLKLAGQLGLRERAALDALLERERETLAHLRLKDAALGVSPSEEDLTAFSADGFVGAAVEALVSAGDPSSTEALRRLYALWHQLEGAA